MNCIVYLARKEIWHVIKIRALVIIIIKSYVSHWSNAPQQKIATFINFYIIFGDINTDEYNRDIRYILCFLWDAHEREREREIDVVLCYISVKQYHDYNKEICPISCSLWEKLYDEHSRALYRIFVLYLCCRRGSTNTVGLDIIIFCTREAIQQTQSYTIYHFFLYLPIAG